MSSSTIDIQLNVRVTSVSKLLTPNMLNVELDNRHSAQHLMSSSTIDIQLNIRVMSVSKLLTQICLMLS